MQNQVRYPFNAVKVFAVVARLGSVKKAGLELSVTAGAVSRQVKILEENLGELLFHRSHNAIRLSKAGQIFYDRIQPAIATIDSAAKDIQADAQQLTLRIGVSFAARWLIPKLDDFKQRHPEARIRLETTHNTDTELPEGIDIAITYRRQESKPPAGKLLLEDYCQPLATPELLTKHDYRGMADLKHLPALGASKDNWDWHCWIRHLALDPAHINLIDQFDTDDTVIHAALAGMGMTLMSSCLTQQERLAGTLQPLPGTEPVKLGAYYLLSSQKSNRLKAEFEDWLFELTKK